MAAVAAVLAGCGEARPPAPAGGAVTVLAAGDIAECDAQGDEATAAILDRFPDAAILTLGDNAYPDGTPEEFAECYGPSWGRHLERTYPALGNHEYATEDAAGYFGYFGEAAGRPDRGYYSFDLSAWHVVALNSECRRVGGCDRDEPQATWLAEDLERSAARCTLAYWHRPPFTSGRYADDERNIPRMRVLWEVAVEGGVDVVLTGHEHSYERFAPMDAEGRAVESGGARLFVVGTGGGDLRDFDNRPLPETEARDDDTWGVLRLDLRADGYDWEFLPAADGTFRDSGSGTCSS